MTSTIVVLGESRDSGKPGIALVCEAGGESYPDRGSVVVTARVANTEAEKVFSVRIAKGEARGLGQWLMMVAGS